jgi:hypothetical protein
VWTHLAGVYDAAAHKLTLYVNGTLAATTTDNTAFNTTGVFAIGRGKYGGAAADYFRGSLSDIQVYGNALTAVQVSNIYSRDLTPITTIG